MIMFYNMVFMLNLMKLFSIECGDVSVVFYFGGVN